MTSFEWSIAAFVAFGFALTAFGTWLRRWLRRVPDVEIEVRVRRSYREDRLKAEVALRQALEQAGLRAARVEERSK